MRRSNGTSSEKIPRCLRTAQHNEMKIIAKLRNVHMSHKETIGNEKRMIGRTNRIGEKTEYLSMIETNLPKMNENKNFPCKHETQIKWIGVHLTT